MRALGSELLAHKETSLIQDVLVPRAGGRNAGREYAHVVGNTIRKRTILKTETIEAKSLDWFDVTNAGTRLAGDHDGLLFQSQLGNEGFRPLEGFFPASNAGSIRCDTVNKGFISALSPRSRRTRG